MNTIIGFFNQILVYMKKKYYLCKVFCDEQNV